MKSKDLIDELMALQFLKQQEVYELKLQLLGLSRSNAQKVVGLLCRSKCEVISIFAQEIERKDFREALEVASEIGELNELMKSYEQILCRTVD